MGGSKKSFILVLALLLLMNTTVFAGQGGSEEWMSRGEFVSSLQKLTDTVWEVSEAHMLRPEETLTKEEAARMMVSASGYDTLADVISQTSQENAYLMLAKDFGLFEGIMIAEENAGVKREEAGRMLANLSERFQGKISAMNGFYAIQSYNQIEMINSLSSVGFGWSRLEYKEDTGLIINTKRQDGNEYGFPSGYEEPFRAAKDRGADALLMVSLDYSSYPNGQSLASYFLSSSEHRQTVADLIVKSVGSPLDFDGVVVDFENIRADQKENFTAFLQAVKAGLQGKKLYVAVQPARRPGLAYYDGYDYKAMGNICDKIILMAHDYAPKALSAAELETGYTTTPVAPLDEVYYALKAITDKESGVGDTGKIMLQLSFDSINLKVENGKMLPPATISYGTIEEEILNGAETYYSKTLESPYIKFTKGDVQHVVWYEDARSVGAKINLAQMFGIQELSVWRLGIVPNSGSAYFNVWETILKFMGY